MTKQKTALYTSCVTHGVQDGLSAAIYVLLPILAQTFGLSYGQVGLFKAVKSLTQSVLEISSGLASERLGERKTLVFSLLMSAAGFISLSFAKIPDLMLMCFVIMGIGGAYHHAPSSALVAGIYTAEKRRRILGIYNSSGDAGKLIFTALISVATLVALTWQTVVFGYGLITIGVAVAVYWGLKKVGMGAVYRPMPKHEDPQKLGWGILNQKMFLALLVTILMDSMVQAGVLTFVAFVMIEKGVPVYAATFASVLVLIGGMFGKAVCGFLADRIGLRQAFSFLQVLTSLGLVLLVLATSTIAFILLPVLGVAVQGTSSITYVVVNDLIHPDRTARGYSLIYTVTSIASVGGALGFGLVGDHYGIEIAILAMAVVAISAILPCSLLKITRPAV